MGERAIWRPTPDLAVDLAHVATVEVVPSPSTTRPESESWSLVVTLASGVHRPALHSMSRAVARYALSLVVKAMYDPERDWELPEQDRLPNASAA